MTEPPKLLDRVSNTIRVRHYSPRTEEAYVHWIRRFILYHGKRHPSSMGAAEVNAFLSHLAVDRTVSASTQNQALAALLFLYRHVLGEPLPWLDDIVRAQRPERLPVVLTIEEVRQVNVEIAPPAKLVVELLYGTELRLLEALALHVKDVDFARGQLTVRDPKWKHDRTTMLPAALTADMRMSKSCIPGSCIRRISRQDGGRPGCRTPSPASCRPRREIHGGTGFSRRRVGGGTAKGKKGVITFTKQSSSAP